MPVADIWSWREVLAKVDAETAKDVVATYHRKTERMVAGIVNEERSRRAKDAILQAEDGGVALSETISDYLGCRRQNWTEAAAATAVIARSWAIRYSEDNAQSPMERAGRELAEDLKAKAGVR